MTDPDFSGLTAAFVNCTLKRSPEVSHTDGLLQVSAAIMRAHGVTVDEIRAVDHELAPGVHPDMTEHGWARDDWPRLAERILAADILVIGTPIWLGDKSSVCTRVVERLYSMSGQLNDAGQYLYCGRAAGVVVTGNEDGIKHVAMNVLYSLQHLGYAVPPNADAGWIGEAGPGPSYLDEGSGGPQNEFTQRNTTALPRRLRNPPIFRPGSDTMNPLRHLRLRTMLDAFVDDELAGEAAAQVSLHLPSCWWCGRDVQTIRLMRAALSQPALSRPVRRRMRRRGRASRRPA